MFHDQDALLTVGHSNRSLADFMEILQAHGVETLADVRRWPKSRRHPHFNDDSLRERLPESGIRYESFCELGGRRKPRSDSQHTAWRVDGFRGYADYMDTEPFREALEGLMNIARQSRTAIMCAEAAPWRCHRRLIADALVARGWSVEDILDAQRIKAHRLPAFATVEDQRVVYRDKTLFSSER